MGVWSKIKSWFSGKLVDAGYPVFGRYVAPKISAGSYYDSIGGSYFFDGSKWSYGLSSAGRGPIIDHAKMRANARSAVHDSAAARSIVERYQQTVVDIGVRVECSPYTNILGITEEQSEQWASEVEERFHLWASSKLCTMAEDMTLYQAQRYTMRARMRDGEYFVRCYYDNRRDLLNPLRIGFLDPNQIQGDALTNTAWPVGCIDGIKRDEFGREVEYSVMVQDAKGGIKYEKIPAKSPRTGLPVILHGYAPEYAGQIRGFSAIGHALHEFEMLTDFTAAQIKKAIIQSSITMFVKPSEKAPALNPFADIGSGPASQFEAPQSPLLGSVSTVPSLGADIVNYSSVNDVNMRPGSFGCFNLMEGQDLKPFDGAAPSESFSSFVEAFVGYLAASVNMPPEILMLKFNANYSASRAALILFWRVACIERDEEASDFYNPIFRTWLVGEIASGRISAPGWSDPRMRAAWCQCSWNGPPMPNIDPSKTAKADKDYIELGAQTLDAVARNLNGSSGASNRAKNKRQIAQLTPVPWTSKSNDGSANKAADEDGDQNV
jgi:lambda family phage portal protein